MSQRGSCQGIERTTTGFALIALAVALASIFANISTLAVLAKRMSCKVLFQAPIELAIDPSVHEEQIVEYPNAHH